jgi:hypothetical protein
MNPAQIFGVIASFILLGLSLFAMFGLIKAINEGNK